MENLITKRRSGVFSLLVALMLLAAGAFVSVPAQAAEPNSASVSVDIANQTITYKQSYDAPLVGFVVTDARGARNVPVPNGNVGKTETFNADWGTTVNVRYLDPVTELFKVLGDYPLSSSETTPPPPAPPVLGTLVSTNYSISCETGQPVATWTLATTSDGPTNIRVRAQDGISIPAVFYMEQTRYPINGADTKVFTFAVTESTLMFWVFSDAIDSNGTVTKSEILYNEEFAVPVCPSGPPVTTPPTTDPLPDDTDRKIRICHSTHSRAEAYESIEVPIAAILAGHGQHEGDIIPPFPYVKQGLAGGYPGNRWTEEGQAIYNNNCTVIPVHTPSPTETEEPTETAEPSPTETTTATPSPTTTATSTTTASPSPTATVTTAPSETTKATPSASKTSEQAIVTTSKNPGSYVDTAVKGSDNQSIPVAPLFFGGAAVALLLALFLLRPTGLGGRRH